MIYLEGGSLWCLCKDDNEYFIQQLSGSMHSETTATYKLTKQEVNCYLDEGIKALSKTINYFSNLENYSRRPQQRAISTEITSEISKCITQYRAKNR